MWSLKYVPLFTRDLPTSPVINDRFSKPDFKRFTCQVTEPIVLASLVLAGNFHLMDGRQKINVLDRLLQSYHISIYDVFVLSNSEDSLSEVLQTSHVLASGPGANRSASGLTTTITWHARCGVIHLDDALFQVMQKLSEQLTYINSVSYAPIGWHVVTGFQKRHVRRRRNIAGTTTLAYSTTPISRATVITTKIKITKTTYVSPTKTFTWSRPLPTFSSPYTSKSVSLSSTRSLSSQYRGVISTSMSLSSVMFTSSQIMSGSNKKTLEISQNQSFSSTLAVLSSRRTMSSLWHASNSSLYRSGAIISTQSRSTTLVLSTHASSYESVKSTLSVMSQSRNKSVMFPTSPSKQRRSSHLFESSYIHGNQNSTYTVVSSSGITTSYLPPPTVQTVTNKPSPSKQRRSSRLFESSSIHGNQNSTYTVVSSSGITTSHLPPPTVQTVTNKSDQSSTFFNPLSAISSVVIHSLLTTANFLTSSSKVSNALSPNETKPAVNRTSGSSKPLIKTTTDIASPTRGSYTIFYSYSFYVPSLTHGRSSMQKSSLMPSPFLSCSQSCSVSMFSMIPSSVLQYTKTPNLTSSITSNSMLSNSGATGTFVLNTSQISGVDKTVVNTTPSSTKGKVSTLPKPSRESSDYIASKIIKTLIVSSTIQSSSLGIRSTKTMQVSSRDFLSSQVTSSRVQTTLSMRPSSSAGLYNHTAKHEVVIY